jgi:hypothetical protein
MSKGIPGCLLVINENESKLGASEETTCLGVSEFARLNILRTKPGESQTRMKMLGDFCLLPSRNFS